MSDVEPFHTPHNSLRGAPRKPPARQSPAPSEYAESDGRPMAETPVHWRATVDATDPLHEFFRARDDVYVGSNMMMYYREGDPTRSVAPDVWVALGVPKLPERRTWLIWQEGKGPDFVLEITSKGTRREDEGKKKKLYERLGVQEYWQFDPTGDYLEPRLKGRELGSDGTYRNLVLEGRNGFLCHSSLLGLELRLEENRLVYFDPVRNDRMLNYSEERRARQSAEARVVELEGRLRESGQ